VTTEYAIDDAAGVEMLTQCCQAVDLAEALSARIAEDGEIIRTMNGIKAHPAIKDGLAARGFVVRTLQKLGLNFEPLRTAPGRPPGSWVMPTKRIPLDRRRTPRIDAETLALFKELELVPPRRRHSAEFKRRDLELHERLDLTFGYKFMSCSVLNRERTCYEQRPGYGIYEDWHKARAVRLRLLALAGMSEPQFEKAKPARRRTREPV
jgi:hypothetical protein